MEEKGTFKWKGLQKTHTLLSTKYQGIRKGESLDGNKEGTHFDEETLQAFNKHNYIICRLHDDFNKHHRQYINFHDLQLLGGDVVEP